MEQNKHKLHLSRSPQLGQSVVVPVSVVVIDKRECSKPREEIFSTQANAGCASKILFSMPASATSPAYLFPVKGSTAGSTASVTQDTQQEPGRHQASR